MNEVHLQDPSKDELLKTYRKLARFDTLKVHCETNTLNETMSQLEDIGYIGFHISYPQLNQKAVEITCTKAKHGPCYDCGQSARYTGSALAALDDDAHLLFQNRDQALCLKTAEIYQSKFYHQYTQVSDANQEKLKRLESDPIIFDCDDYAESLSHLLTLCPDAMEEQLFKNIFYAGPFKALISPTGYIIRRGQWCSIPQKDADDLNSENLSHSQTQYPVAEHLKQLIDSRGPEALLNLHFSEVESYSSQTITAELFRGISESLRNKMVYCIEHYTDNFMVTGSDPQDEFGCCPSQDVGMANQLLRAGVLDKAKQELGQDQCPIQIYTFKGELAQKGHQLDFSKNETIRQDVLTHLKPKDPHKVLRWVLFIFVIISLLIAFKKIRERHKASTQMTPQSLIETHQLQKTTFVLYHHEKRCEMCLEMENITKSFSKKQNSEFLNLNMDEAQWKHMIEEYQLFSAALFVINPGAEPKKQVILIKDAWEHWRDPKAFNDMLLKYSP